MNRKKILFPLSIIVAGLIIAGGIFLSRQNYSNPENDVPYIPEARINIRPISAFDHVLGNPNADVIIVEYSDFECPYCKEFHATMERVMENYGKTGKVAWVYRHFPIEESHPNSRLAAEASECVAKLGGEAMFWDYASIIFESSPTSLSKENLGKVAGSFGIETKDFEACLILDEHRKKIDNDIADGLLIYENDPNFGTPYNIIISKTGIQTTIVGSQPYSAIKNIIETF